MEECRFLVKIIWVEKENYIEGQDLCEIMR